MKHFNNNRITDFVTVTILIGQHETVEIVAYG
jgi:hypothetical protein